MGDENRSFPERAQNADVFPLGLRYRVTPMDMIVEQIKHDSMQPADENAADSQTMKDGTEDGYNS